MTGKSNVSPRALFMAVATPTEAAGVGAFGALLLALQRKQLSRNVLTDVLQQTTTTTAFIFAIFVVATAFSLVLRGLGGDELIESALLGLALIFIWKPLVTWLPSLAY